MAKDKKPQKKSKVSAAPQAGDVEFFDEKPQAKPNSDKMSQDIQSHPKFDKFKKGNE